MRELMPAAKATPSNSSTGTLRVKMVDPEILLLAMAVTTLPGRWTGSTPSGIVTETGSGASGGSGKISAWLRSATAAIVFRPSDVNQRRTGTLRDSALWL
jgi:hypothetical protein